MDGAKVSLPASVRNTYKRVKGEGLLPTSRHFRPVAGQNTYCRVRSAVLYLRKAIARP